jgi:hypothetical protein
MSRLPVVTADGWVAHAPSPPELLTRVDGPPVLPGELWVGGSKRHPGGDWDLVVSCTLPGEVPPLGVNDFEHWELGWQDGPRLPPDLDDRVGEVADWLSAGRRVLVRCYTGQNRSVLLAALAYEAVTGIHPSFVVEALRGRRAGSVMCNPAFCGRLGVAMPPHRRAG